MEDLGMLKFPQKHINGEKADFYRNSASLKKWEGHARHSKFFWNQNVHLDPMVREKVVKKYV